MHFWKVENLVCISVVSLRDFQLESIDHFYLVYPFVYFILSPFQGPGHVKYIRLKWYQNKKCSMSLLISIRLLWWPWNKHYIAFFRKVLNLNMLLSYFQQYSDLMDQLIWRLLMITDHFLLSDCEPDRGDGPLQRDQHHLWLWPLFTGRVHRPQTTELPGGDGHVTGSGNWCGWRRRR